MQIWAIHFSTLILKTFSILCQVKLFYPLIRSAESLCARRGLFPLMHDCTWSSHSIPALCVCLTVFLSAQQGGMKHLVFTSECWETGPVSTHTHTCIINKRCCDLYYLVQRFLSECVKFGLKHTLTHTFLLAQSCVKTLSIMSCFTDSSSWKKNTLIKRNTTYQCKYSWGIKQAKNPTYLE